MLYFVNLLSSNRTTKISNKVANLDKVFCPRRVEEEEERRDPGYYEIAEAPVKNSFNGRG